MNVLRAFTPAMRFQGRGAFTLFSSGPVPGPNPLAGWHNACEAAVCSMMESIRAEFEWCGISVSHIACGLQNAAASTESAAYIDRVGHANAYDHMIEKAERSIGDLSSKTLNVDEFVKIGLSLANGAQGKPPYRFLPAVDDRMPPPKPMAAKRFWEWFS